MSYILLVRCKTRLDNIYVMCSRLCPEKVVQLHRQVYMLFRNKIPILSNDVTITTTATTMFNRTKFKLKSTNTTFLTNQLLKVQTYKTFKRNKVERDGLNEQWWSHHDGSTELLHQPFVFLWSGEEMSDHQSTEHTRYESYCSCYPVQHFFWLFRWKFLGLLRISWCRMRNMDKFTDFLETIESKVVLERRTICCLWNWVLRGTGPWRRLWEKSKYDTNESLARSRGI